MRILIIEDNPVVAQILRQNLTAFYAVDICKTGKEGLHQSLTVAYDTILLDLNLPDISGETICHEIRKQGKDTPVIILSGKGEIKNKVTLLNMGADDYVTKPFNLHELRARIDVAMRRNSSTSPNGLIIIDGLELDPTTRTVRRHNEPIALRRKEFDLLEYLMRNQRRALTRPMILEHIWDMNEDLWANVVDVHIKHLRDKIDRPYGTKLIRTVHGVGYKIEPESASESLVNKETK